MVQPILEIPRSRSSESPVDRRGRVWLSLCPGGRARPPGEFLGAGPVGAHPVAFAVDVEDDAAVQQAVEHGGGEAVPAVHAESETEPFNDTP
jgi:hypothetical protein